MTLKELQKLTQNFSDIQPMLEEKKRLQVANNRVRNRLNTSLSKYKFLSRIVGVRVKDNDLIEEIIALFRALGIQDIQNVDKRYHEEDIRMKIGKVVLIIEVTGTKKDVMLDDKALQIIKHVPLKQRKFNDFNVFGLFVVNHDNEKHYTLRNKKPFRKELDAIAKSHNTTLTTTIDLLNAFIKYKNDDLTPDEIITKLCQGGELKI